MISPVTGSIISLSNSSVVSATAISFRIRPDPTHRYSDSPTLLWWFWVPALRKKVVLLGDVVLVGEPDPDGQPTSVPAPFAGDLLSQHGHRVKLKVAGEKGWYRSDTIADNYFAAIVLAFDLLDSWPEAKAAQIVPCAAHEA